MSASKFFLGRNLNTSFTLICSSKWAPKTFSTLSYLNLNVTQRLKAASNLKILSKPQIKLNFINRRAATSSVQISSAAVSRCIGIWLMTCGCIVYATIMAGGYTRLTESGLSMVNWRFTFEHFPSNEDEWLAEFEKYKEYPEFKMLKNDLTLEGFKNIFQQEYFHRNLGRSVGLVYLIPASVFWALGLFKPKMKKRIFAFGLLIVAQGLLGWYMVKSGLQDRFHEKTDIPRVSQYRLAAHLGLALTLYTGLLLSAFELLLPVQKVSVIMAGAKKIRMLSHSCKGLIFLTALSGALVAGLDAGLVYNSFPKMGDSWIPDDIFALSPFFKNFTENPTTVQFDHRILGITTFTTIMATWVLARKKALPRRAQLALNLLALGALGQVSLGISTLVHYVPTFLALTHQSGSVLLLTIAIWLSHELKFLKHIPK